MNIKELKEILKNCDDDMEINIVTDGNIYHSIEIYCDEDYVYMEGYKNADKEKYGG